MKNKMKFSATIALAGILGLSAQVPSPQTKESKRAAKQDATQKDDTKSKKIGKTAPAAPVDLNAASQADLEKVPGIGAATAKKIISNRPFSSVADLSKAGLSAKQIQELSPMLTVSPGAASMARTSKTSPPNVPPAPSTPAQTSPTATPAPSSRNTSSASTQANYKPATPPPGPGMVWVNTSTKVFHRAGTKWYGNTKAGKYMTEADAVKAGYRESKEN